MSALEVILIVVLGCYFAVLGYWLTATARRLDDLHKRSDHMLIALDGALQQRSAVICVLYPPARAMAHNAALYGLDNRDSQRMQQRAEAEAELLATLPEDLQQNRDITEAQIRVELAIRFYNEAAMTAELVRERFWIRFFRLGGHAPVPRVYPVTSTATGK